MANASFYKGLTIELGVDTKNLYTQLRNAQNIAKGTTKELNLLNRALKFDPTNVKLLAAKQDELKKKIKSAKDELEALKAAEQSIGKENMPSEQWNRLQSDISKTTRKLAEYEDELKEVGILYKAAQSDAYILGDAMVNAGGKIQEAGDKIKDGSQKLSNFGDKYTQTVTAPIIAAGSAAVAAAVKIDDGLTSVRKTVNGTEEQYLALKQAAIDFSETNAVSADQMLELYALGAQLGFGIEELEEFGRVAAGLDIATDMNAEQAATELAQFANITQMAHGDAEKYASAIVNLGNNLATTESKISSMSQRIAAQGTQVHMSQDQILGWAGAMSSLGIEAEAGGTAFSKTLAKIDTAVATSSDKVELFAKVAGMSVEDFSNAWNQDASATMEKFLKGLSDAENMSVTLSELDFNDVRMSDALKRMAGNTDLLTKALKTSEDGWRENVALSDEVENKNNALSAKFEMLKNKVIAVAESVGTPLAGALMDAIDAAQPLIDVIKDGAKAFQDMSKAEQTQIIQAVAAVAAIGPLLSTVGRLGDGIGSITKGVGSATKTLGEMFKSVGRTSAAVSEATGVLGKTKSVISNLHGGLVGIGVAAAAAVAAFAITKWMEYQKKIEDTEKASKSLGDIQKEVQDEVKKTSEAAGEAANGEGFTQYNGSIDQLRGRLEDLQQAQIDTREKFQNDYMEFSYDELKLQGYLDKIKELGNKDLPLTKEQQTDLALAVKGYNDITGDSLQIIDEQTGKLSKNTQEIAANTRAMLAQKEVDLFGDQYAEAYSEQQKAIKAVADAQSYAAQKEAEYKQAVEESNAAAVAGITDLSGYEYQVNQAQAAWDDAKSAVDEAQASLNNANDAMQYSKDQITKVTDAQKIYEQSTSVLADKINRFSEETRKAMGKAGFDLDTFGTKLQDLGTNTESFAYISHESFERWYNEAGGNVDDFTNKINDFANKYGDMTAKVGAKTDAMSEDIRQKMSDNGISVEGLGRCFTDAGIDATVMKDMSSESFEQMLKDGNYTYDGIRDALIKYNDTEMKKKDAKVDDHEVKDAQKDLDKINVTELLPKIVETDTTEVDEAKDKVEDLAQDSRNPITFTINAIWDGVKAAWNTIQSWFGGGHASGGIVIPRHAAGGFAIPKFASGGILDRPTLTSIGWVGEAGAEAIIPLSNARYVKPFARAVAEQMSTINNNRTSNFQIVLNGAVLNDDAAMQEAALDLLVEIQRKAGMNRG